jgi:flagellar biosynthesis protein FlhG
MPDFHPTGSTAPLDQAEGLRRRFAGQRRRVLPLAANPHVASSASVLDRVAAVLARGGREVLVVDAGAASPPPSELALVDLGAGIERVAPRVSYLAARGLPMRFVDTRGSAAGFVDAVQAAAPQAEVVLLHADGTDLIRLLKGRAARPMLIGADHPESIKHAYAGCKLLVQRCGFMTFDLLLLASPFSPRVDGIAASLSRCADGFLGALVVDWALIDPSADPAEEPDEPLARLLAAQLALDDSGLPEPSAATAFGPDALRRVASMPSHAPAPGDIAAQGQAWPGHFAHSNRGAVAAPPGGPSSDPFRTAI